MKKAWFGILLLILLATGGCLENGKGIDNSKKDDIATINATYVDEVTIPEEDKAAMLAIQNSISKEYPLTPTILSDTVKRATNPTNDQIIAAMKSAGTKYNIPFEVLYGIGMIESNLRQYKSNGQPLISGDEGYGIMQVTPWAISEKFNVESLKWDYKYNIEAGAQVILGKWKYASGRNPIGNNDPKILENWYITIWAYNGYSKINNPNEYVNGPRTWNNGMITWTRNAPYQVDVLNAIYNKFGIKISRIPNSQLPSTGIPASGKSFTTPQPIHYTSNTGPVVNGSVTLNIPDTLRINEVLTISGTASQGVDRVKGYIDDIQFLNGDVAVVGGKYSFTCTLTKTGNRKIKIVGSGSANATLEKSVSVIDGNSPQITINAPDTMMTNVTITVSGTATNGITKVRGYMDEYALSAGEVAVVNGKYSFTMTLNQTGNRVLKIVGTGNGTVTATKNVVVKEEPKVTITCADMLNIGKTVTVSGTATSGITKVRGYIDDIALNAGEVAVLNGKYSFTMVLTKTGNRVIKLVGTGSSTVTATKNVVVK